MCICAALVPNPTARYRPDCYSPISWSVTTGQCRCERLYSGAGRRTPYARVFIYILPIIKSLTCPISSISLKTNNLKCSISGYQIGLFFWCECRSLKYIVNKCVTIKFMCPAI